MDTQEEADPEKVKEAMVTALRCKRLSPEIDLTKAGRFINEKKLGDSLEALTKEAIDCYEAEETLKAAVSGVTERLECIKHLRTLEQDKREGTAFTSTQLPPDLLLEILSTREGARKEIHAQNGKAFIKISQEDFDQLSSHLNRDADPIEKLPSLGELLDKCAKAFFYVLRKKKSESGSELTQALSSLFTFIEAIDDHRGNSILILEALKKQPDWEAIITLIDKYYPTPSDSL